MNGKEKARSRSASDHFEVLVIGNGPSAITLSYLLSGNWPYYDGQLKQTMDESLQMLHARLMNPDESEIRCFDRPTPLEIKKVKNCRCFGACSNAAIVGKLLLEPVDSSDSESNDIDTLQEDESRRVQTGLNRLSMHHDVLDHRNGWTADVHKATSHFPSEEQILQTSLVERNLKYLSQGLIGRSFNPISLLFDHLQHPEADTGKEKANTLRWQHLPRSQFSHKVLGKGLAGGAWAKMDDCSEALTISLGSWMQLPNYSIRDWLDSQEQAVQVELSESIKADHSVRPHLRQVSPTKRICLNAMANYYRDFVRHKRLERYFENYADVRHVRYCGRCERWMVSGRNELTGRRFCYTSNSLVLASGCSERDNRLQVPGEQFPFVLHSFDQLEQVLTQRHSRAAASSFESMANSSSSLNNQDPILIVGAGLSAADAILASMNAGIPVLHAFRKHPDDPSLVFNQLPESLYPEYHRVHKLMGSRSIGETPLYRPFAMHEVACIRANGEVELRNLMDESEGEPEHGSLLGNGCTPLQVLVRVRTVLCQIGQQPDLSFIRSRRMMAALTDHPELPVDPRSNPIQIDSSSHECARVANLYAMGPLVGDNFVRFLQGGALAICSDLFKKRSLKSKKSRLEHAI
jgi:hypothetical protein